jgi:hypothetical protein
VRKEAQEEWSKSQTVSQLHQVLIQFSDLNKMCVGQNGFGELLSSQSESKSATQGLDWI